MDGAGKRALIVGVSGQDGSFLARHLLGLGYEVHGTSRGMAQPANLSRLGLLAQVRLHCLQPHDYSAVLALVAAVAPDEIYNLAGQSSVGLSFAQPREAFDSHVVGTMALLEALRALGGGIRLFNASSGEVFGDTGPVAADEATPFRPCTPYGAAKASAALLVATYRQNFGIFACTGFLFNHESPLRGKDFVSHRIVSGALAVARKQATRLTLGNMAITRDWGWAPDFVESYAAMLQQPVARDYVVSTGQPTTMEQFVARVFSRVGLDWRDHVTSDPALFRPSDISVNLGSPALAEKELGWRARTRMPEVADNLVSAMLGSKPSPF